MELQKFYTDEKMREEVKAYITRFLEHKAIEYVFGNKDVKGIAEAKALLENAFSELEVEFGPKPKIKEDDSR